MAVVRVLKTWIHRSLRLWSLYDCRVSGVQYDRYDKHPIRSIFNTELMTKVDTPVIVLAPILFGHKSIFRYRVKLIIGAG